jgi:hypothetical protein
MNMLAQSTTNLNSNHRKVAFGKTFTNLLNKTSFEYVLEDSPGPKNEIMIEDL